MDHSGRPRDSDSGAEISGMAPHVSGAPAPPDNTARRLLGPPPSLPKGGGAIRGLGEKFAANVATGAGTFSVPVPTSPGRSGFGPTLALGYDSARGNGPFGLGWQLDVPLVSRRTDRGIPTYDDRDTFVVSGAEDLVPVPGEPDTTTAPGWSITRYRPRVESQPVRVERWARGVDTHWRVWSADNVLNTYGADPSARVADPADPTRVLSWLLSHSRDHRGNVVAYTYRPDDGTGLDLTVPSEANRGDRDDPRRTANRYLKAIRYGNRTPMLDDVGRRPRFVTADELDDQDWLFELVLDYGEHDVDAPTPDDAGAWTARPDPFATYRSGFEVRTTRLCRRFLMFHHVPDNTDGPGYDGLVGSLELTHGHMRYSTIVAITQHGHRRSGAGYVVRSMPPLELEYSAAEIDPTVRELGPDTAHPPAGLIGYEWTDLHGEGVPGLLQRGVDAWHYRRNISPVSAPEATFTPASLVAEAPHADPARTRVLDLAGDGLPDLVSLDGPVAGLFEHDDGDSWSPFRAFDSPLPVTSDDQRLRLVDLDGDGRADALMTAGSELWWHRALGEGGFGERRATALPADEEQGPAGTFADPGDPLLVADMSGDGLADLVRVRNGEVCYWPNLGHGRFGAKVTMDGAPTLDEPEQFDPARVRLADIDGSGTTDLVYLHRDGVRVVLNRSGNGWDEPITLDFAALDDVTDVDVLDLLGDGTAALVWSSPLPSASGRALRYVRLLRGKPHLLTAVRNNLGSATTVSYAPTTRFAVADRLAGRPWLTKLPFPVHVVEQVRVHDLVGRNTFTTTYRYHHGCFDRTERELAGFGMVETIEADDRDDGDDSGAWRPPTLTRTWHHCGDSPLPPTWPSGKGWADDPAGELVRTDAPSSGLRALRGQPLRTEVYAVADDGSVDVPYQVTQHALTVRELQAADTTSGRPAVTRSVLRETVTASHEQEAANPRIRHDFTLEVDDHGNPLRTLSVAYPRRTPLVEPGLRPADTVLATAATAVPVIRASVSGYTRALADPDEFPDDHRAPAPSRMTVAALAWPGLPTSGLATWAQAQAAWASAQARPVAAEVVPDRDLDPTRPAPGAGWRVVADRVVRYRRDDLAGLLAVGDLEPRGLPGTVHRLALTDGQVTDVLGGLVDAAVLAEAGYVRLAGETGWWAPEGDVGFSPDPDDGPAAELAEAVAHFFLPRRVVDAFGGVSTTDHDPCDLLQVRSVDPVGNVTSALVDFRVLAPREVTDVAGCRSQAAFDALGRVVGIALLGTAAEPTGDSLAGFVADLPEAALEALAEDLDGAAAALGTATSRTVYDRTAFRRTRDLPDPSAVSTTILHRRHHTPDDPGADDLQVAVAHHDGHGREVQRKTQAEPGPVVDGGPVVSPRWVGSSWVILDRAGEPAQTFEPFFSSTHRFEFDRRVGEPTTVVRDPLRRVVGRLYPDGSWEKTVFSAWRQEIWDRNDTVLVDDCRTDPQVGPALRRVLGPDPAAYVSWRRRRIAGEVGNTPADVVAEQDAAAKATLLAATPAVSLLDAAGRLALAIADAGPDGRLTHRTAPDLEGRPLAVTDALGRTVVRQVRRVGGTWRSGLDLMGRTLVRDSMDAGRRLTLPDVEGHPVRTLDPSGTTLRWTYDALRRPTHLAATPGGGAERLLQRWVYGEGVAGANAAGRVFRVYDSAGMLEHTHYDVQGNLTDSTRRLAAGHRGTPDWSALAVPDDPAALAAAAEALLEDGGFRKLTWYDAIGRPVQTTTPASADMEPCVLRHGYGEGGLLDRLDVWLHRAAAPAGLLDPDTADLHVLTDLTYDAAGRTTSRVRGNGTTTDYRYDAGTARLLSLTTTRPGFPAQERTVQALAYTHDPVGNVTRVRDTADLANAVFFRNRRVEPGTDYTYDHLYRLIRATGREHVGLADGGTAAPSPTGPDDGPRTGLAHPGDGNAVVTYVESYRYDEASNMLETAHVTASGTWRRGFAYDEPSAIDPADRGNRLSATGPATSAPASWVDRYGYDADGTTTSLPHLPLMTWDLGGRLASTASQVVTTPGAVPETTHYQYDGDGERTRLTIDRAAGPGSDPAPRAQRVCLPGLEIDRELAADGSATVVRETLRIDAGDETVALVQTRTVGNDPGSAQVVRHQYATHVGSAALELAGDGAVLSYEEYFPYGGTSYAAARDLLETPKRDRWLGKPRDPTGLMPLGVRYYAPWLGRWLSPDPSETADGLNVYVYARANPVTMRDANGREVEAYYIAPGRPGNQPWMWFLGVAAHRLIAYHYEGSHLAEKRGIYTNYIPISTILTDARIGDPNRLTTKEQNAKPDITNVSSREVFEIKPWNSQGEADARKEVKDYQTWLNKGMGVPPGGRGDSGPSEYPFLLGQGATGQLAVQFHGGKMVWRLTWKNTEDGVVLYKWQKTSKTDRDEIREAGEGQWVDITEADAQAYGEEVHAEVEKGLGRRQSLFKMMDVTNAVQEVIGSIAVSIIMGAMLGSRTNVAPRPGVPPPAPGIRPPIGPPPAAPPPVVPPKLPPNVPPPWMLPPPGGTPPPPIRPGL